MKIKKEFTHFGIAWKRTSDSTWKVVKDPSYGWTADPFLISFEGRLYLFAEIFLFKSERNGVIGYCEFNGEGFGEWIISMDRHWHLSYPNVFVENNKILMCPETWQLGEIALYELVKFPNIWQKRKIIISNSACCDSTFFRFQNQNWMFTYQLANDDHKDVGLLYRLDDDYNVVDFQVFSESKENNRCGGKVIKQEDKIIRVSQCGVPYYGKELVFYEIDSVWPKYSEHEIKRINSDNVSIEGFDKHDGVHTYNISDDIEVIDFRYKSFDIKQVIQENMARVHTNKVFLNKY